MPGGGGGSQNFEQYTAANDYTDTVGPWANLSNRTLIWNLNGFTTAIYGGVELEYVKKAKSCYVMFEARPAGGYVDAYAQMADGSEFWTCRFTTGQVGNPDTYAVTGGLQSAASIVCVCSGYDSATSIRLKVRAGLCVICGLGWRSEETTAYSGSFFHSDNVIGNPSSLNDERIKDNVSSLDPSNCLSFCNMLQPSLYLQTLSNEVRTGLIAQEVQATLAAHSLPLTPVLDTKMASIDQESPAEELMSMRYERLVPMLLGAVKALTQRIEELESK